MVVFEYQPNSKSQGILIQHPVISKFRVKQCSVKNCKGKARNGKVCPSYHSQEERRRDPYLHVGATATINQPYPYVYSPDECRPSERNYHPLTYKRERCQFFSCEEQCFFGDYCFRTHQSDFERTPVPKKQDRTLTFGQWLFVTTVYKTKPCQDYYHPEMIENYQLNTVQCPKYHNSGEKRPEFDPFHPNRTFEVPCRYGENCTNYRYCQRFHSDEERDLAKEYRKFYTNEYWKKMSVNKIEEFSGKEESILVTSSSEDQLLLEIHLVDSQTDQEVRPEPEEPEQTSPVVEEPEDETYHVVDCPRCNYTFAVE